MKKIIVILSLFIVSKFYSQSIYKGLEYGMTKSEAKKEFKKNRDTYINIDLGNGFTYRIYRQNFIFIDNKLVCIPIPAKGSAMGFDYDTAKNYLTYTKKVFEDLGYKIFIDDKYYNTPISYESSGSKWGLIMYNKDKTKLVQLYPSSYKYLNTKVYQPNLRVWHYDSWMKLYNEAQKVTSYKKKKSGF